jgi:large subunit ribosomal protein L5
MSIVKEQEKKAFDVLKGAFGYKSRMQSPRVTKVVVSVGTGKAQDKKTRGALVSDRLAKITGQKPSARPAKKSIASFKLRQGEIVGYQVTLRGARMYAFLDKLIHIALPRTRDFRGINVSAIDDIGNITLGIKEHTIFPEAADEELKDVFGLAITIGTSAKNKKEAEAFLRFIGVPFKK